MFGSFWKGSFVISAAFEAEAIRLVAFHHTQLQKIPEYQPSKRPSSPTPSTHERNMNSTNDNAAGSGNAQVSQMSLFEQWTNGYLVGDEGSIISGMWHDVSTKDAKKDFFLTADDLYMLPCASYGGGWGIGPPMNLYDIDDLISASLRKFGRAEIEKKLLARQTREEKKRMKEQEAELARKRLKADTTANVAASESSTTMPRRPDFNSSDPYAILGVPIDASTQQIQVTYRQLALAHHPDRQTSQSDKDCAHKIFTTIGNAYEILGDEGRRREHDERIPLAAGDTEVITQWRNHLLKMAISSYKRSSTPKTWRFEVPGTDSATFAALMDQPKDVELTTFVKNGAYYTIQGHLLTKLFGVNDYYQLARYFYHDRCAREVGDTVVVRYKPSTMVLSVSGTAENYWLGGR